MPVDYDKIYQEVKSGAPPVDYDAIYNEVRGAKKKAEPSFGSRLYDTTIGPVVDIYSDVKRRAGSKVGSPLAAVGEVGLDVLTGAAKGLYSRYADSPQTQAGNPLGGAAHAIVGPMVEPMVDDARAGRYGALAGGLLGNAAMMFGPKAIGSGVQRMAAAGGRKLMQSTLKPTVTDAKTLGDVARVTETALQRGIPVDEGGLAKAAKIKGGLIQDVQGIVDARTAQGATIDPRVVAGGLDDMAAKAKMQPTPDTDVGTILGARDEFLRNHGGAPIPFDQAQAIKQGGYKRAREIKANPYGEQGGSNLEAVKGLTRKLKEEMERLAPEIAGPNRELGNVINLEDVIERTVRRTGNADLVDLTDAAIGTGAVLTLGPGAVVAPLARKVLGNPAVKSRLAIAIYQGAKASGKPISFAQATTRAGSVIGSLMPEDEEAVKAKEKKK